MNFVKYLCALCVLCGSMSGLDRNAFTFLKYNLEVRVDPAGEALAARGKILLRNDSASPQPELAMQISSSLEWRLVHINGKDVQYSTDEYVSDIDHTGQLSEVVIQLPAPVAPRATVEIEVGYSGQITRDATRLTTIGVPERTAGHTDWDHIGEPVTAMRGIGYVAWYPIAMNAALVSEPTYPLALQGWKDRERDSSMDVSLCWVSDEHEMTVIANGIFVGLNRHMLGATEEATTHAGCSQYSFRNLGWTVPAFAIGEFSVLSRPVIDTFYLADQGSFAQEYAAAAEKDLPLDTQWFGAPKTKIQVVQLPDPGDAPYESGTLLITPLETTDPAALHERMMHQLVHASFPSPRPWIEEGLAHFGMALLRADQGRAAAVTYMDGFLPVLQAAEKPVEDSGPRRPAGAAPLPAQNTGAAAAPGRGVETSPDAAANSLINSPDEVMYRIKAMFVWWMLRDMVGDTALQSALSRYRPADDKLPSYLPDLISREAHKDLSWFFDDWVYRDRGLPDFHVVSAYPRQTLAKSYVVAVTLENLGGAGAEVPVIIHTPEGNSIRRMTVKAHDKAIDRFEVPVVPTDITVNDGSVPESDMKNNSFTVSAPVSR